MCDTLDIPKSTYYQSFHKTESNRDRERREFTEKIIEIHEESKKRYGAPKIHKILVKQGHEISLNRVQRLMKEAGIQSIIVKKFRPTPSKEKVEERENIINRDFSTTGINQKWIDIGDLRVISSVLRPELVPHYNNHNAITLIDGLHAKIMGLTHTHRDSGSSHHMYVQIIFKVPYFFVS
ncbi:IS3 family transposase [Pallidibacillus thermolactis]|jgi:pyruvate/2-oxoacid:ferredoxin oxidoreductase alpha subunit|uniref:IS3 family transposase n=1 Tax=Pallidibacillus thermolactis TaxID=251051 RepID=UPI0021DA9FBE|nr:IS3 family transposase [Pallidibacillus thermolactis]MCU9600882.1 IS3 family transposase [Pallidibacillus thermolactis subsp. kokeshiiformis]